MKFPSTTAPCLFLLSTLQQPAKIVASGATTGCDPNTPSLSSLANFTDNLRDAAASSPSVDTITCPAPGESDHSHKRVLLIGIDGLRADAAAMLPLPNLHRLSQMGTSTVRKRRNDCGARIIHNKMFLSIHCHSNIEVIPMLPILSPSSIVSSGLLFRPLKLL